MEKAERIAKVIARAGLCSRRDAEKLIEAGHVMLNGTRVTSPATTVSAEDSIKVKGKLLPPLTMPRLWIYYKPLGLVTTHKDEQNRPTVFDNLPSYLPRVVSVGRLDLNSEGLLLLTNDGGLARRLELPANGWKRRYRVRVYGVLSAEMIGKFATGVTVEGVRYGPVEVLPEKPNLITRNQWMTVTLTEGKNREIRKLFEHADCRVSRLIRMAYGPFQLGSLEPGSVREVPPKVMREQLGMAEVGKVRKRESEK